MANENKTKDQRDLDEAIARAFDANTVRRADDAHLASEQQSGSLSTRLFKLVVSAAELWVDENTDEAYVTVTIGERMQHLRVQNDRAFSGWLRELAVSHGITQSEVIRTEVRREVVDAIQAMAPRIGHRHPTSHRIAVKDGTIYWDLGRPDGVSVAITAAEWQLSAQAPVKLLRHGHMKALPHPVRASNNGALVGLRDLLGLTGDDLVVALAFVMAPFLPAGSYPILVITGPAGSGKSTLSEMLKRIVDPTVAPRRSPPKSADDLFIGASRTVLACFDNIRVINPDLSDCLCRISTGGGYGKRKHYADTEEIVIPANCALIVNGIGDIAQYPDLIDRSLIVELRSRAQRMSEADVWERFEGLLPGIIALVCDALVLALRDVSTQTAPSRTRLVDFERFARAAAPSLGLQPDEVSAAMGRVRDRANATLVGNESLVVALQRLLERAEGRVCMTAAELLAALRSRPTFLHEYDIARDLPQKPNHLSRRLNELEGVLHHAGITMRTGHRGRSKVIDLALHPDRTGGADVT